MLNKAGFKASPVILSTRSNGIPIFPTIDGFNYVIAAIEIENDFVLAMTGYLPDFDFLKNSGIELQGDCLNPLYNSETMETNIPGLYLAGVVCGGKDTHLWFIENSRIHAEIIIKSILSK